MQRSKKNHRIGYQSNNRKLIYLGLLAMPIEIAQALISSLQVYGAIEW